MSTKPRVTLGVPVYNGEKYLAETLESLVSQDFREIEIIISDNASTDRTPQICAEFSARDSRIRYVRSEQNTGGPANHNKLVHLARGEYFKWAAADDLCSPDLVGACVKVLDEHPEVVLAYPPTMMIDAESRELGYHDARLHLPYPRPWQRLFWFARRRRLCNPDMGVMRLAMLRETRLIRPYISSDITHLAEVALAGQIWEVRGPTFYRRLTDTSVGLGSLTRRELVEWHNPSAEGRGWLPMVRVFIEIELAIFRSRLTPSDKLLAFGAFTVGWVWRRSRLHYRVARASVHNAMAARRGRLGRGNGARRPLMDDDSSGAASSADDPLAHIGRDS